MIDFVLGLVLAAMLVRGWFRGLVREVFDLVGLVIGVWIAFRLSAPVGEFLSDSFNLEPEIGRIGAGLVLFIGLGVVMSVAAHYLTRFMNLPGLSLVNRVGGAAVAVAWGILLVLILVTVVSAFPVPASWRDGLEDSNVVEMISGEDAMPRSVFETLAGDDVMGAVSAIRELFGEGRAVPVGDEALDIPAAASDDLLLDVAEAEGVVERINEHRVGLGLRAVAVIPAIVDLAEDHAVEQYQHGRLVRLEDCAATLGQRSYQVLRCENGVALAGTAAGGLAGILDTPEGEETLENPDLDRAGVAVVDGPTGRLLVVILAG
ncbi:MAG: CvpA family protein [Acidimicrobiia bacterium]|jgi:uncharacterized membrane protein required for colicin V production